MKSVNMETLKKLFAKHFSAEMRGIGAKENDFLTMTDYGKAVKNADVDANKALDIICNGEYTKEQVVHIRLSKDLSNGWAVTVNSICIKKNTGFQDEPATKMPYTNIDMEAMLLDTALKAFRTIDYKLIEVTDLETFRELATRQALVGFLREVKEFMK